MIPSSWSLPKKDFECSAIICQMRGPLANVSNCSGGWAARELLSRSLQNFGLLPSLICPLGRSVFFFSMTSCCISCMALHLLLLIFDCFWGCRYMWFRHGCYGRTISLKCLVLSHYSLCVCVCVWNMGLEGIWAGVSSSWKNSFKGYQRVSSKVSSRSSISLQGVGVWQTLGPKNRTCCWSFVRVTEESLITWLGSGSCRSVYLKRQFCFGLLAYPVSVWLILSIHWHY